MKNNVHDILNMSDLIVLEKFMETLELREYSDRYSKPLKSDDIFLKTKNIIKTMINRMDDKEECCSGTCQCGTQ